MVSPNSRARLVTRAEDWRWSSARAHLDGRDDGLTASEPLRGEVGDWGAFLAGGLKERDAEDLRRHERTGRPLGDAGFLTELEERLGRRLRPGKRGRRKAGADGAEVN